MKKKIIKSKIKRNNLRERRNLFFDSLVYLYKRRNYVYLAVLLFLVSGILGFFLADKLTFLDKYIIELISEVKDLTGKELVYYIFTNNLDASFRAYLAGLVFGIIPIFAAISNGVVLGYVLEKSWQVTGIADFWRILPHGVFELPAIFISIGLGIRLGVLFFYLMIDFFRYYSKKNNFVLIVLGVLFIPFTIFFSYLVDGKFRVFEKGKFEREFYLSSLIFVFIVIPLLVIAAIIEGSLIAFLQ